MGKRVVDAMGLYAPYRMMEQGPRNYLVVEQVGRYGLALGLRMMEGEEAVALARQLNGEAGEIPSPGGEA